MPASRKVIVKKSAALKARVRHRFPIVAIGASVGGLEAVSALIKNLPVDTGMAFIYVQHLNPHHKSILTELLSRTTKMKVQEIDDMELMKPDNIYVIPGNKGIKVTDGHIKLIPRSKKSSPVSIDVLFSSLAATHHENVVGIILSGNGQDGTIGLKAIQDAGGLTFAQDDSAQASSMPRSAIDSGVVEFVLSPEQMAKRLVSLYVRKRKKNGKKLKDKNTTVTTEVPALKSIFELLRKRTGVDFSHYKMASIRRRLEHKMLQAETKTIDDYYKLISRDKKESEALYNDLLINVTAFFRDKEVYRYLKNVLFPKLLSSKLHSDSIRIWVPACSTGEEAYSIAMILTELQENKSRKVPVQIFATDLSAHAIQYARIGAYPETSMKNVSDQRLKRFFTKTGKHYQVVKTLREMCVFAPHNILSDPPFFRIDFVSCRNLLIYFDASAQKKALATIHFSLNEGKYLLLGKSETTGGSSQLFTPVSDKFKAFARKKDSGKRVMPQLMPRLPKTTAFVKNIPFKTLKRPSVASVELESSIDAVLLSNYMPSCVVINKDMEILQFRGQASMYLSHPAGKASLNIFKMMRPEYAFELRSAIQMAMKTRQTIKKTGIEMKIDSVYRSMSLEVSPLKIDWDEPLLLIVFSFQEWMEDQTESGVKVNATQKSLKIKRLTEELNTLRQEMHAVIESQETAYEELQIANEEIVSTNEEFQTLNEELETSKEEIEATNEELISTNQELQMRNELLTESYNYSEAIISTIHEPLIVLDEKLHVRSASKSFYKKFHTTKEATEGFSLFQLGNRQWNIPQLHVLLGDMLSKNVDFDNFEVAHTFLGLGDKVMLLNAHRIQQKNNKEQLILLAIDDITERSRYYLREKELLYRDIRSHKADKEDLERAVKRRTRQLELKNLELESANKDLTSFTYISSHDLQEPLRKIQNFVAVILQEEAKNLSSSGKEYFERLRETARRMQLLIEDLLSYSRTKGGKQNFEYLDLSHILTDVIGDFDEVLKEKKGIIEASPLGKANVIPFQFRQLFHNLIGNSLKFSRKDVPPHIVVKSKMVKGDKLNIEKLSPKKNYLHLTFLDNGVGFDPKYRDRIFEVFQRLHSFEEYRGTGIGLAICKRIVENHQGVIIATGKPGKGARFDIYIPAE